MPNGTCSVDGCDELHHAKGYCIRHYTQWRRHGDPLHFHQCGDSRCSVEGCPKPSRRHGLCGMHAWRLLNWGHVGSAESTRNQNHDCAVEGCTRMAKSRGWCRSHYERWRRKGDVGKAEIQAYRLYENQCHIDGCDSPQSSSYGLCETHSRRYRTWSDPYYTDIARGEESRLWRGDDVGYAGAHDRVRRAHGTPSRHRCEWCGSQADDWAYDHADPDERISNEGWPFSLNVGHYQPMCRPCHVTMDRDATRRVEGGRRLA